MKEWSEELSYVVYKCHPYLNAQWTCTVPQKERGLVMKHDKAIIDLTERESSAKKAPGTTERRLEHDKEMEGEAKDRLPEKRAWIQILQMQNPSVLVNLD